MHAQTITTPTGERLVVLSEADFKALVDAADDAADRLAMMAFRQKLGSGDEELVPAGMVDRLLRGESRVRVWREHRDLTAESLAALTGIAPDVLSGIEADHRAATLDMLRSLASALDVTLDDLAGPAAAADDPARPA